MAGIVKRCPGVLVCDVTRRIKRRLLINFEQIEAIERIFGEIHAINLSGLSKSEAEYISERPTSYEVKLSDGATYPVSSSKDIASIRTSKSRRIESINVTEIGTTIFAKLDLGDVFALSGRISIEGPEDKAEHYANKLERVITENSDYTVRAKRFSSFFAGILGSFLVTATLFMVSSVALTPSQRNNEISAGTITVFFFAMVLWIAILVEAPKERWLPDVSLLWGYGERQHAVAKTVIKGLFFTFPVWLAGVFLPNLF